jgi:hypothetical protein
MITVSVVALVLSVASCVLAIVAYLRAAGRDARHEMLIEDLSRRAHKAYQDLIVRASHAQTRLAGLRVHASVDLRRRIDELDAQVTALKHKAEDGLASVRSEPGAGMRAAQVELRRRMRELEAHVHMLLASAEIAHADSLADEGDFADAEVLLEDAVAKVRESKARLADDVEDEPYFTEVIAELQKAIRSLRLRAEDYRRQIDRVVAANDTLLGSLERREHVAAID